MTSHRPLSRTAALLLVAVLGVSACSSDPSARRVAEDLVKTEAADQPEVQECMLAVIESYDDEYDLDKLGEDAQSSDEATAGPAQKTLDEFEDELAACR